MNLSDASQWATIGGGIGTIAAVFAAWFQLRGIKNEMRMTSLMAVLEIETQMNERKVHFDQTSTQIRLSKLENASKEVLEIHCDLFKCAKESYFNALDRLCFCILKEYIKEKDWRAEYRNVIKQTIDSYSGDFGEASPFHNIKDLNRKWQRE